MGQAKRQQEREEENLFTAVSVLAEVGVIKECEYHPGTYIDKSDEFDNKSIYAFATAKYKEKFSTELEDIKKFHSYIQPAIEYAGEECYSCRKNEED